MSPRGQASAPRIRWRSGQSKAPQLKLLQGGRGHRAADPAASDLVATRTAIYWIVGALCAIGLVMVLSASAYSSIEFYGSAWKIFQRQLLWMVAGAACFAVAAMGSYRGWRRVRIPLLLLSYFLVVAVFVPGVGIAAGGSSRWIGYGMLRIQPSEVMKLALAVFVADLMARRADRPNPVPSIVVPVVTNLAVASLLVLAQPDMGTAVVLVCIVFSLFVAGGIPWKPLAKVGLLAAAGGLIVAFAEPYRRQRLLSFINPFAHAKGSGYQVVQSLVGLGAGHLYGLGLGGGREKWGLLPNAHTDFIFSIIGEEGGLIGTLLVLLLFGALAFYGLRAASRAPDRFGGLLAIAVTCWITSQAVINIGAVIGVLPVTGIPLPFVSFGGSSLVIAMTAAGVLANIAGHERVRGRPPARALRQAGGGRGT